MKENGKSKKPVKMPLLDIKERTSTFKEVELGFSEEEAVEEASRCLQCENPKCMEGCLAGVPISEFIKKISERKFEEALKLVEEKNFFPRVCGRICKHELQCEDSCILAPSGEAIAIGALERFVADYCHFKPGVKQKGSKEGSKKGKNNKNKKRIAILGSGPSGLTAAMYLAKKGYAVKVIESSTTFGGVIKYGVPEFRLPKKVVEDEIKKLLDLGVRFELDNTIGRERGLEDLRKAFSAVFIGTGLGTAKMLNIKGKELEGIAPALNILIEFNQDRNHDVIKKGERIIVIGGGYVGLDVARTLIRLGANVTIATLESIKELPVARKDLEEAREEGVKFLFVLKAVEYIGKKKLEAIKFERSDGSETILKADKAILAIGQKQRKSKITEEIVTKEDGLIHVNERMQTNLGNVFAAGDCVTGPKTVIEAIVTGKEAAENIVRLLENGKK